MRWKASPPALIWRRTAETRLQAVLWALPAVVCWGVLLLAYAGVAATFYVDRLPVLDILSPLRGHFIGLALAAAAGLVVQRRALLVVAGGAIATILAHAAPVHLAAWPSLDLAPRAEATAPAGPTLKVLAANVWRDNQDPAALVASIRAADPDVVLLAEVKPVVQQAVAALRESYPYAVFGPEDCTQVLLSRIPLKRTGLELASAERPALVWAELGGNGPGAGVIVAGTHLYRPTRSWHRHTRQLAGLIASLNALEGPLVLGGDLNATPNTRSFRELTRQTGLTAAGPELATWPAHPLLLPQFRIDHIMVRGALSIRRSGVGAYAGSDHLPVWAEIATPARPGPVATIN